MSEGADSARPRATGGPDEDPRAAERRIFRDTCIAACVAVAAGAALAPWRVTAGLLLGGALAVFNHYWLRESVAAVFGAAPPGRRARLGAARFVLRYFVIAAVVFAAVRWAWPRSSPRSPGCARSCRRCSRKASGSSTKHSCVERKTS